MKGLWQAGWRFRLQSDQGQGMRSGRYSVVEVEGLYDFIRAQGWLPRKKGSRFDGIEGVSSPFPPPAQPPH